MQFTVRKFRRHQVPYLNCNVFRSRVFPRESRNFLIQEFVIRRLTPSVSKPEPAKAQGTTGNALDTVSSLGY